MVQFRFFVKAADATVASKNFRVRDMFITNGINNLALIVANKSNSNFNGKLYWFGKEIDEKWMYIKLNGSDKKRFDQNGNGSLDHPLNVKTCAVNVASYPATTFTAVTAAAYNEGLAGAVFEGDAVPVDFETKVGYPAGGSELTDAEAIAYNATLPGAVVAGDENGFAGYIMLAPSTITKYNDRNNNPEPNNTVYRLVLKVRYNNGASDVDVNIVRKLTPPVGGFQEGKIYNIVVNVDSNNGVPK
jgi:hypothetical protein